MTEWPEIGPVTTLSLPDRLSVTLERLILEGKVAPGDRFPAERELAERLSVSRPSIRQALRELETRGLIDRRPGRGTIVLAPGESAALSGDAMAALAAIHPHLHEIMELRSIIEPPIARLTAVRATPRDVDQLRALVEDMEHVTDPIRYAQLDRAFHQSIAQYTHNALLSLINEQIALQIAPSRAVNLQTPERRDVSTIAHRRIYEAIAAGDADAAGAEALAHVLDVSAAVARASSAGAPSKEDE
jgi:GntR family transcriptional repressor for pyruvate dehydrogenase complex